MTEENTTKLIESEEAVMDGIVSHIPRLIAKRGWTVDEWRGRCIMAGMSMPTADRLYEGDTNVTLRTLRKVCDILNVRSISELVEFSDDEPGA